MKDAYLLVGTMGCMTPKHFPSVLAPFSFAKMFSSELEGEKSSGPVFVTNQAQVSRAQTSTVQTSTVQTSTATETSTKNINGEVHVPVLLVAATDGSCRGNPGAGGWCWYVDVDNWKSGGEENTTNNKMELFAVKEILAATENKNVVLTLKVDSKYTIDACTKWIYGWRKNGWMTASKKPVANKEVIQEIFSLLQNRKVRFEWVKGHSGNVLNEAADIRACAAADMAKEGKVKTSGPGYVG